MEVPSVLDGLPTDTWRALAATAGERGFARVMAGEVERIELTIDWGRARALALAVDTRTASDVGYVAKTVLGFALQEHAPRAFALLPGPTPQLRQLVGWRLPERLPPPPGAVAVHVELARAALSPALVRPVVFVPGRYRVRTLCVPALRQGRRHASEKVPARRSAFRFPGLGYGEARGAPDPALRDYEAASWIWHRLARPGLFPIRIGDEGEPRVRADQFITLIRKDDPRSQGVARAQASRHHVLDGTVEVAEPGALALLALSRLGSSGFAGYGMVHVRAQDEARSASGIAGADWPSVRALLDGRSQAPRLPATAGAAP